MTKTSGKKTKKSSRKRKATQTTLKQNFSYLLTIAGSVLFFWGSIAVLYPNTRDYFLSKIIKYYVTTPSGGYFHFEHAHINLWDFSVHLKNIRISNPIDFPDEPALQSGYLQTKFLVLPNFKVIYKLYINDLQINLYYLPGKGTNIGSLLKILKKDKQLLKNKIFDNINSIYTEKIEIVITQNIEPQKIEINTPQYISINPNFSYETNVLEHIINSFVLDNKDIPEDFRLSLTNDMKHNTI